MLVSTRWRTQCRSEVAAGATARHAVHGHVHYGSEIDLQLQGTWRRLTGLVKLADYSADRYATHTRKLWLEMDYVL